jgi:hypothetical protein
MDLLLVFHVSVGLLLLTLGAVALLGRKSRRARHPLVGNAYFAALTLTLSTGLVIGLRHPGLTLFELATPPTFALGLMGWWAGRVRREGWLRRHIAGMAGSYIGVITAFGFQAMPRSLWPIWWVLPTVVGSLLIARATRRLPVYSSMISRSSAEGGSAGGRRASSTASTLTR